jgi:hypothetical protein
MKIVGDGEYRAGEAYVKLDGDKLIIGDRYTSRELIVSRGTEVEVRPVEPLHVPKNLTENLLIRLEKPLYTVEPMMTWVKAPYELEVRLNGSSIAYLSPTRVKYYLYGDVVEGVLCRYHETGVYDGEPGDTDGEALIRLLVTRVSKPMEYLLIPLENISVWEDDGKVYYNPILIEASGDELIIKVVDRDPHKITLYEVPVLGEEYEEKWRYRI